LVDIDRYMCNYLRTLSRGQWKINRPYTLGQCRKMSGPSRFDLWMSRCLPMRSVLY